NRFADIVEVHGSDRVRTTPMQKLLVLDVEEDRVESLISALDQIGLQARPSQWRRNTMACTGIEYCKLAIVNTKDRAKDLVNYLEAAIPELDTPISVNVNGCPNSCARI
ncbi:MAG: nitrite/sulfite reductase, partial [Aeromicrobium sp.]